MSTTPDTWVRMRVAADGTGFTPGMAPADKASLWMALAVAPEPVEELDAEGESDRELR